MKKIILYAAISLDGKIAAADGSVKWLDELPNPDKLDYGYFDFYDTIDVTLMGNKTYQQVLGFDVPFPYVGKSNYVLTRDEEKHEHQDKNVTFIAQNSIAFIRNLKSGAGKDIWLVGGAAVNTLLLNHDLIDRLMLFVMPIMLGSGIPLFSGNPVMSKLQLTQSQEYPTGVVGLTYDLNV